MGILSGLLGAAAPLIGNMIAPGIGGVIGGALGGAIAGSGGGSQSGSTTATQQQQMDPRMQAYLYGDGTAGNTGLLGKASSLAGTPQSQAQSQFGSGINDYLKNWGAQNFVTSQQAAQGLQSSNMGAPQMFAGNAVNGARMDAAQVAAPSQNNLDLSGAYSNMINGNAGANPYLTNALQAGVDATNAGYNKNVNTLTDQLQRTVLPGIRSNSVLAGQYGGTRQGIAEGNAISDYTRQLSDNNAQLAAQNSANTIGAQAQAFNQGQDRSLSAMTNLSGQQYATAGQNAQLQQQANSQISSQAQQAALHNSTLQQATNQANLQAKLGTNQLNSANQVAGVGLSGGLLGQAYNYGNANDNYDATKLQQATGILGQFSGLGGSSTSTQPYYTNSGANLLGGATAGLGLYNQMQQSGMFGSSARPGGSGVGASPIASVSGGYNTPDLGNLLSYNG